MRSLLLATLLFSISCVANAQLEAWKDYEPSKEVWSVSTVKVDSNMGEVYLEGLANTWAPAMKAQKELGHIEDFWIFGSDLPAAGDFNMMLVVKFADTSDLAPNKARYNKFIAAMTKKKADESNEYARSKYPNIREITGEYLFREINLK